MPAARRPSVQNEGEPPSTPRHHDSTSPPKWEVNKVLDTVKDVFEENAALRESIEAISDNLQRERLRGDRLEHELIAFQRKSEDDDYRRDRSIRDLAEKVEVLNRPKTEASGAAGAATVINAARKRETALEFARWIAIVIVFVLTMLGVRLPETKTDVVVPDTKPRPAGTGFAGQP